MELYERLREVIAVASGGNVTAFCKKLSIRNTTMSGYLNEYGQDKVRVGLLLEILEAYPQISRDWLFFNEGEMFSDGFRMGMRMGARMADADKPPIETPVTDAVREAETGLRRAGGDDNLVWMMVARLAKEKAGLPTAREEAKPFYAQEPRPETDTK